MRSPFRLGHLLQFVVLVAKLLDEHAQIAADVALNQFNAGTVSYTTVITDIQALIADQESLLTMQQNQLVANVSLIEALGGGWDVSRL